MPSSATRRRVASAPGRPRRYRHAVKDDDVLVHRGGQRGRAAVVGQLALHVRRLSRDRGAATAELDGNAEGEEAGVAEGVERLRDEGAVAVVAGGVLGERGADRGRAVDERSVAGASTSVVMCIVVMEPIDAEPVRHLVQDLDLAGTDSGLPAARVARDACRPCPTTAATAPSPWPARCSPTGGRR